MPIITRRIRPVSFEENLCTLSGLSIQKDFVPWRQNLPKVFFRQSVSAPADQETIVLVVHDDFRG